MAGKKDIVEQALKMVMGAGEKTAPSVLVAGGKDTPISAWHLTEKPFASYDWGLLGSTTRSNVEGTGVENWAMDLARVGPWSSEKKIDLGYGIHIPIAVGGKGKAFNSLDELQKAIARAGGPDKFRQNMTAKGFGHLKVADEEFGGTSYVSLTPETFMVRDDQIDRASGGSVREGYAGKGRVVSDTIGKALEVASEAFAPEKTVKAYKLFKQRDGKLYPLYVGANEEVPLGQWLKAKPGELLPSGKVKAEISGGLAYRPGWHAGDLPVATHIGAKSHGNPRLPPDTRRSDEVWAEVEMPDDVDWQSVANERARITKKGTPDPKTAHITDQVPYGGFYRYKTSPTMQGQWLIGGDMRVNRLLTDDEVKAINDAAGVTDLPRREGYQTKGRVVGDIVDEALKLVMGKGESAAEAGIRAYHASPHDFDKFEWSPRTSMTGEGAQSYGAGLYFAESPSVSGRGGTYDKQFTRKLQEIDRTGELGEKMGRVKIGGKPSTEYGIENDPGFIEAVKAGNVGKYARERLDRWHELSTDEKYPYRDYAAEKMRAWEKLLNDYSGGADVYYPMKARIYETNIAADPEKMMRWDEPLKDQPVEVLRGLGVLNAEDIAALQAEKRALESKLQGGGWNDPIETQNPDEFWEKVNTSVAKNSDDYSRLMKIERELSRAGKDIPDVTSGKFYKSSSEKPENISLELRDRGVPGIQFWDGNSRGKSYFSQWRTDPLGGWTTDAFPSKGEATEYLNDVLRSAPALKGDERFSRVIQNPKATSNYVITNDKLISIIRKYGIAGASAMLGYNLMENLDPKQAQAASMADQDFQASRPQRSTGGNNSVSNAMNVARGLYGEK